jgi:hypothetical protein
MSCKLPIASLARLGALSLSLTAAASMTALAADLVSTPPSVHVASPGVMSYAQLIEQLRGQGYSDVKVTALRPSLSSPRPELVHGLGAGDDEANTTPVHQGWNGTAVKDGRTVDIYVDPPVVRSVGNSR